LPLGLAKNSSQANFSARSNTFSAKPVPATFQAAFARAQARLLATRPGSVAPAVTNRLASANSFNAVKESPLIAAVIAVSICAWVMPVQLWAASSNWWLGAPVAFLILRKVESNTAPACTASAVFKLALLIKLVVSGLVKPSPQAVIPSAESGSPAVERAIM